MISKVEALVRNFLRTGADSLWLVPGEKIFVMRGDNRAVVGRENLSNESFRGVAGELVPGGPVETLAQMGHRVVYRIDDTLDPVDIEFRRAAGVAAIVIRKRPPDPLGAAAAAAAAIPPPSLEAEPESPPAGVPPPVIALPAAIEPPPSLTKVAASRAALRRASLDKAKTGRPIDDILLKMLDCEASDVHLSSGSVPVFRVHGDIVPQSDSQRLVSTDVERLMNQILPEKNRKEFAERNDTDFAYEIADVARFRVNVFRDRHGVAAVFRQIPLQILTAEELGLPAPVVQLGDLSKGLVLVTGPTGSGKSTTLAALIDSINEKRSDHIITIEDPIEFVHPNKKCLVNQREVGTHTRGFKDALRAALREDPDIVLVGEMRDLETIAIAIETAETGHLVFGTLHTTTATSTVDRIVDQFPADRQQQIRVMLADSLRGVVAQTLCKRIGGGRIAALEVLLSNNAVQNLIRDGKTFQLPSILQTSKAQGMVLLNDSLLDLVKRGLVEPREAYLKAVDKPGLLNLLKANGIKSPLDAA